MTKSPFCRRCNLIVDGCIKKPNDKPLKGQSNYRWTLSRKFCPECGKSLAKARLIEEIQISRNTLSNKGDVQK